jgi:hypothetical protein
VKLMLLALLATRLFITSHVVDGNCPANKLLEMFSTTQRVAGEVVLRSRRPPRDRERRTLRQARYGDRLVWNAGDPVPLPTIHATLPWGSEATIVW